VSLRLVLTAIISLFVQFGLAILGWGGFAAFYSHPAFVWLTFSTLGLLVCSFFTHASLSAGEQEDRGNRWVLAAFSIVALLLTYLSAFTDRIGFWTLDGNALRWAGLAVYTGGGILRLWPVFVLGRRFSGLVAIQPGHTLQTTGIYGTVRNPSYAGLLVTSIGWAMTFQSGVGVILALLMLIPLMARIHSEERLLQARFGAEYEAYCTRTWRLVPHVY
jgi:protein-S-isoprenylcysteine O-methyltransferase Ste14